MEKRKEPVQMENKVLQTGEFVGERIDRFLSCKLEEFSRSYIQRLMKEGHVKVGEKAVKANYKLCKGTRSRLRFRMPASRTSFRNRSL